MLFLLARCAKGDDKMTEEVRGVFVGLSSLRPSE